MHTVAITPGVTCPPPPRDPSRSSYLSKYKVKVLFFASCREMAGTKEMSLFLPGDRSTTSELREAIARKLPGLKPVAATVTLALNQEYLDPEQNAALKDGDEVAFIPPISGG